MKRNFLKCTAGLLAVATLTSGVVFAKQASETINVIYDNIKIMIDGKEYLPTDANGKSVEPFIYNGTTYLPVRAIANAFDKDVDWEAQTSTVTLGSKNYDWLDQLGYVDYETTSVYSTMTAISSGTKSNDGIKYDRGLKFSISTSSYKEDNKGRISSHQTVEYLLNKNYKTFTGNFISLNNIPNDQSVIVKIYGDGNLIYTSPVISYGSKSTPFEIDVADYKILKLHIEIPNLYHADSYMNGSSSDIGIADARLAKK